MKRNVFLLLLAALMLLTAPACAEKAPLEPLPWDAEAAAYGPHEDGWLPDNGGYHDDSLDIRVETFQWDGTNVMAVRVKIADPTQLRTALAAPSYPSKQVAPVRTIMKKTNGVLGINDDYFSYHKDGIVVRNGIPLRERPNDGRDTLIIDDQGDFTILHPTTGEAWEAFEGRVVHAFCFGPGLVIDGEPMTDMDSVKLSCGKNKKTQRIVLGQTGPLEYLILTCEGPENTPKNTQGMTLTDMALLAKELGCINAYNLDGGSSSTVVLNGQKINALSSGKERTVSGAIWFATLAP